MIVPLGRAVAAAANFSVERSGAALSLPRRQSLEMSFAHLKTKLKLVRTICL
jgi:hypothetical protein